MMTYAHMSDTDIVAEGLKHWSTRTNMQQELVLRMDFSLFFVLPRIVDM